MTGPLLLFAVLAAIAVVCGISMILQENPVRSALYLVVLLFCVALLFLTLNAAFIAAVQVVVYAGAIMVLFIFVIMLLNLGAPDQIADRLKPQRYMSAAVFVVLVIILTTAIVAVPVGYTSHHLGQGFVPINTPAGTGLGVGLVGANEIGMAMFDPKSYWLFPFEILSILLLVAAVGAVMLAKKRI
jgi:NADH-quinone oxidoreductase subunit J